MQALTMSISVLALVLVSSVSRADAKDGKLIPWDDSEQFLTTSNSQSVCTALNSGNGMDTGDSPIACKVDHASFDHYFTKEYAKFKIAQRDQETPQDYCGPQAWYALSRQSSPQFPQGSGGGYGICADCVAEFKKKVKTIECMMDEKATKPSIVLKGDTLTFKIAPGTRNGWQMVELRKVLPALDKFYKQHE